jgi:hypothetical protein
MVSFEVVEHQASGLEQPRVVGYHQNQLPPHCKPWERQSSYTWGQVRLEQDDPQPFRTYATITSWWRGHTRTLWCNRATFTLEWGLN